MNTPLSSFDSIQQVIQHQASKNPDARVLEFTSDGTSITAVLTYADIDRSATTVAQYLREHGVGGHPVLISLPTGSQFVAAFLGCIYAGAIPAPIPPCLSRKDRHSVLRVSADAQARTVIAASAEATRTVLHPSDIDVLDLSTIDLHKGCGTISPIADRSHIAYLQYTSGSTANPRGVVITHANVLHNLEAINTGFAFDARSVSVSWLPHFHDMGLVYGILAPICFGFRCVLFPSSAFAQSPVRWLAAITAHSATHSGAPDFAYRLCIARIADDQLEPLRLNSWRIAFNGAETVHARTLRMFSARFASVGFRSSAFYPAYGLAEATLKVSGGPIALLHVDQESLRQGKVELAPDAPSVQTLTSCGRPDNKTEIRIVDPANGSEAKPGAVGEIWVRGPGVAAGYWRNDSATRATFRAQLPEGSSSYLRTGDLGFLHAGQLFVTGRLKELIIIRGRNYYPPDIEESCRRADDRLTFAAVAAFALFNESSEGVGVLVEWPRKLDRSEMPGIAATLRRTVLEEYGITLGVLGFVKSGGLPKTTSGKVKRNTCREMLLAGEIETLWSDISPNSETQTPQFGCDPESVITHVVNALASRSESTLISSDALTALGLDSLGAGQLSGLIETRTGVYIRPDELLTGMSLRDVVSRVRAKQQTPEPLREIKPASLTPAGRASMAQEALCLLQVIAPDSAAYHIARAFICPGGLDIRILERGLAWVMQRHAGLRTALIPEPTGTWRQSIITDTTVPLVIHEIADADDLDSLLRTESDRQFELSIAPLFRVRIFLRVGAAPVLLIVFHHAIADLASLGVFMRDLRDAYTAIARTGLPPLRESVSQTYVSYAEQQYVRLEAGAFDQAIGFWRDELATAPRVLSLRASKARLPIQAYVGGSVQVRLCPEILDAVKRLSAAHSTTPYVWLLSAFQVLLLRLCEDAEVVVGSPFLGRETIGYSDTIGYFTNMVPLRSGRIGNCTFLDVVRQMKRRVLSAMRYSDVPFARIVQELKAGGDPSRHPIFQAAFVFHAPQRPEDKWVTSFAVQHPGDPLPWSNAFLDVRPMEARWTQFDLTLAVGIVAGAVHGALEFSTSVLDRATATTLAESYAALVEATVADPSVLVRSARLLTAADHQRLLCTWVRGPEYPISSGLVHERFSQWAERDPDREALIFGNSRMSYAELDRASNRVAHFLQERGVVAETPVGLFAERSPEFFAGLLGILKSGGVYVPLNPELPDVRLRQTVAGAAPVVIMAQEILEWRAAAIGPGLFAGLGSLLVRGSEEPVEALVHPHNAAYIMYTSGSTGRPKGVVNTHEGLLNRIVWMQEQFCATGADRILHKTPISFDVSVWELLWPLMVGSAVVIAPVDAHRNPPILVRCIADHGVTILHFVPSVLRTILAEATLRQRTSLRLIVCSGEALAPDLCDLTFADIGAEVFNLYGPTEASIDVSYHRCRPGSDVVPIGRPVFNTQIYILDENMELPPRGFSGEIYIGGVQVARGYLNDPGLTAQRFVPNPFSAGERLYKTGDLGCFRPDGSIEFLGRNDRQVKVHGCRIEPGEVETALRRFKGIKDAVVVTRNVEGVPALVAYVVADDVDEDRMLAELRKQLPSYMCPTRLITLANLPLGSSGKLDIALLPEPTKSSFVSRTTPHDELQATLSQIWSGVLGTAAPDIDADFFALGGHSLQLMQLVSRVRQDLRVETPLADLVDNLTIRRMAEVLRPLIDTSLSVRQTDQIQQTQHVTMRGALDDSFEASNDAESNLGHSRATQVATIVTSQPHLAIEEMPGPTVAVLSSPFLDQPPPAQITCAGIVTANRPTALRSALRSCLEQFCRAERRAKIIICDDASSHSTAPDTRAVANEVLRNSDASMLIVTRETRLRAIEALAAKAVAPREVLEFALLPANDLLPTVGANRNALLLAAGQTCFWTMDDDTEARFGRPVSSEGRSRFVANSHPVEVIPHVSRERVIEAAGFGDYSALPPLEESLGRYIRLPEEAVNTVREHEAVTIISFPGIAGDCGWASPQSLLFADSANRERLVRSEGFWQLAINTREYLQVAPCLTIARAIERCMMTSAALDNRSLLPPFLPVGRGQDTVFGQTVDAMKAGLCVHLPYVVLHSPVEHRTFVASDVEKNAGALDVSQLVSICIQDVAAKVVKGGARAEVMRDLGRRLIEIGTLPVNDYKEYVRTRMWRSVSRQIVWLERSLAADRSLGEPWAASAERYISALRSMSTLPDIAAPLEYMRYLGPQPALVKGQQIVANVGQLLFWWPAIVEAAYSTNVFEHR